MENTDRTRAAKRQRRVAKIAKYRTLTRDIENVSKTGSADEIQEAIQRNLVEGSALYTKVKKRLDGTSADSVHMKCLVKTGKDAALRINTSTRPFDLKNVIKQMLRDSDNDKAKLYEYVATSYADKCLKRAPSFEYFYGALKNEDIVKRERRVRVRERLPDRVTTTAKERDIQVEVEQDSTPKEVELIERRLRSRLKEKPKGVSFFKNVVDKGSFSKTVENIFHTSFLVKENQIGLKRDVNNHVVLTDDQQEGERKQSILSFGMDDYNRWISSLGT